MVFVAEKRAEFQAQNPALNMAELAKGMGEAWKNMNESDRKYWEQKADTDRRRYEAEVAAQGQCAVQLAKPIPQPAQPPAWSKGPVKQKPKQKKGPKEKKRRVVRNDGINKSRMLQLAARAGVARLSGLTYMELNEVYKKKLSEILGQASALAEHRKSRTIKVEDVVAAFALSGVQIFGA